MAELTRDHLHELARLGAQARLALIDAESAAIRKAFPDLAGARKAGRPRKVRTAASLEPPPTAAVKQAKRRRVHRMTAAERKAVSVRMKRYWAARRREKGK